MSLEPARRGVRLGVRRLPPWPVPTRSSLFYNALLNVLSEQGHQTDRKRYIPTIRELRDTDPENSLADEQSGDEQDPPTPRAGAADGPKSPRVES